MDPLVDIVVDYKVCIRWFGRLACLAHLLGCHARRSLFFLSISSFCCNIAMQYVGRIVGTGEFFESYQTFIYNQKVIGKLVLA